MRSLVSLSFSAMSCTCGLSARTGPKVGKRVGHLAVSLLGVGLLPLTLDPIITMAPYTISGLVLAPNPV